MYHSHTLLSIHTYSLPIYCIYIHQEPPLSGIAMFSMRLRRSLLSSSSSASVSSSAPDKRYLQVGIFSRQNSFELLNLSFTSSNHIINSENNPNNPIGDGEGTGEKQHITTKNPPVIQLQSNPLITLIYL